MLRNVVIPDDTIRHLRLICQAVDAVQCINDVNTTCIVVYWRQRVESRRVTIFVDMALEDEHSTWRRIDRAQVALTLSTVFVILTGMYFLVK